MRPMVSSFDLSILCFACCTDLITALSSSCRLLMVLTRVFIWGCAINDQRTLSEENQTARAGIPLKVALTVAGPTPPRYSTCSADNAGMDIVKVMTTSCVLKPFCEKSFHS